MITSDVATLKSMLFLAAVQKYRARVFILEALNGATPERKAELIVEAFDTMVKICRERPAPLVWRFNEHNKPVAVDFKNKLGLLRRQAKTNWGMT